MNKHIEIKGATIHNLKGINARIPKPGLTVITGVSGSGKSSLAFDTLYEEGKRRYLMFTGTQLQVDSVQSFESITGLSPTVAVAQRVTRQSNPRSTVGTRTKISGMLAVLFASYGIRDPEYDDGLPLSMEMFQRNSPKGMCVKCLGAGRVKLIDEDRLFENKDVRIDEFCFGLGKSGKTKDMLKSFYRKNGVNASHTLGSLAGEQLNALRYGDGSFMGYVPWITRITSGVFSSSGRLEYLLSNAGMMHKAECPRCGGTGLCDQASKTKFNGKTVYEIENMYIKDLYDFLSDVCNTGNTPLHKEILLKLGCMADVGLHHLSLSRPVVTLSGGEIQRLFLASYIIADMDSIIFIFDEPTIGLHETEKEKLISIIKTLVERGNTVVAVEHDENFIMAADYIIDIGPDAGTFGGFKVFEGSYSEFLKCEGSRTAPYLGRKSLRAKNVYRPADESKALRIEGASLHNLQNINVTIPLGISVGIAGVSGSGKSSLISDTLSPMLKNALKNRFVTEDSDDEETGELTPCDAVLKGAEHIKRCVVIDQKPIGRSRTSCPASYTGMSDKIRVLFSKTPDAVQRGYSAGMFTVNSFGGCGLCKGDGVTHYHVGYGNFIDVVCDACSGTGFLPEVAEVRLTGKNIMEILQMTVDEAADFFDGMDKTIDNILKTLKRVGMGYIRLGQATPTISGGESQRIKLAKELSKNRSAKDTLYILDEPTTGLSFSDTEGLTELVGELVDKGGSVIITEHDPYVLSNCDYIIELGPGGGSDGGHIIAVGTPRDLKRNKNSIIGRYLYNEG